MPDKSQSPLRFAIIGCGLIGRKRAVALGKIAEIATLRTTCDLDAAKAADLAKLAAGATSSTDFKAVVSDPEIDAVIVATLNASLAPITLAAVHW